MTNADYLDFILLLETPRIRDSHGLDPLTYSQPILATARAVALKAEWQRLYDEPFRGVTNDGTVEDGLFKLADEGFDVEPAVAAAQRFLGSLTAQERGAVSYAVDAPQWRGWYNPEIVFNNEGVRLEDLSETARLAFLDLLAACTSKRGFEKMLRLMKANLFLGELYDLRNIMNEWSYHVLVYGVPSTTKPWGFNLYGHHIGFNAFIVGRQLVVSPTFMGTEPNEIHLESGEFFVLFNEEERRGLKLMQSLSPDLQARATTYALMEDPAMPAWRFNFADQRHLGGAFQDNRIIPYEGVRVSEFTTEQRNALLDLCETFYEHLPDGPRAARLAQIASHFDRTYFSWIGGHGDDDPFYFQIRSPVVLIEFDHHSGMWLKNGTPQKFHIHTITRIPNGNDYGKALLAQYASLTPLP